MPFNSHFKLSMISTICPSHPQLPSPTETPLEYLLESLHFTEEKIHISSKFNNKNNILKEIWRNHLPKEDDLNRITIQTDYWFQYSGTALKNKQTNKKNNIAFHL